VFRHVVPFQLVNSYRLQSIEIEGARFLRNVVVCYITRYTAPDGSEGHHLPRSNATVENAWRHTHSAYCFV